MDARMKAQEEVRAAQTPTPINIPLEKPILMLPAPVRDPVMIAIGAMALLRSCEQHAETVPAERS